jgi:hypothetical protein
MALTMVVRRNSKEWFWNVVLKCNARRGEHSDESNANSGNHFGAMHMHVLSL